MNPFLIDTLKRRCSLISAAFVICVAYRTSAAPLKLQKSIKPVEQNFSFKCVAKLPTSSFVITDDGKSVGVRVIHHNGLAYMPIHEGIIVPNDLPGLGEKARRLSELGEDFTFHFAKKDCALNGPGLIYCKRGSSNFINGKEFEAMNFQTGIISEQASGFKISQRKISLSLWIEGLVPVADINMNYDFDECSL